LVHLDYLPSGDAALTRRSSKYSKLRAVVVRWSRARKRYERQGILVEPEAIEKAEEECLADVELRQARRLREATRREKLDKEYVAEFARRLRERYPGCPPGEEVRIAEHACRKYSGRVGRTAEAKDFSAEAIDLAVGAHIRHGYTRYDELLFAQHERWEAREAVRGDVERTLRKWSEAPATSTRARPPDP
jgi:hypothetical protein